MKHLIILLTILCATSYAAPAVPALAPGEFAISHNPFLPSSKPEDIARMATFGVKVLRFDLSWREVEKTKGVYDWSRYDPLFAELKSLGIRPLPILAKSNPIYNDYLKTAAPATIQARNAFAAFAAAAANRYAGSNPIWEIWNEPDTERFWKPTPDSADYAALAAATCHAIRKAQPDAYVIAPGLSVIPSKENGYHSANWLSDIFAEAPLMQCLSAFSVHPYRKIRPEEFYFEQPYLQSVYADSSGNPSSTMPPILVSEWGYTTSRLRPEKQADYLVRQQLLGILMKQPFTVIYDWRDDGPNPREKEDNFGILTHKDSKPKPAYQALARLREHLHGTTYTGQVRSKPDTFVLSFKGPKTRKYTLWSYSRTQNFNLQMPAGFTRATAINANGAKVPVTKTGTLLQVPITFTPTFLTLTPLRKNTVCSKAPNAGLSPRKPSGWQKMGEGPHFCRDPLAIRGPPPCGSLFSKPQAFRYE